MQENTAYKMLSFSNLDGLHFHLPRSHASVLMHPHFFPVFFSFFFPYCFLPCCYYLLCCFLTYQNIFLHFLYLLLLHTICRIFGSTIAAETRTPAALAAGGVYFLYFFILRFLFLQYAVFIFLFIFFADFFLLPSFKSGILILKPSKTIKKGSKLNHEWS